jgi:hypothetical protein
MLGTPAALVIAMQGLCAALFIVIATAMLSSRDFGEDTPFK